MEKEILRLADDAVAGLIDPLKAYIHLKRIEKNLKMAIESVHDSALSAAQKYGQKSFTEHEAKIEIGEVGTKYDYANCGDTVWTRLETSLKTATENKKNREEFLKTLKNPMTITDEESGEIIEVHPPVKSSKTGLKISIK